MDNWVTKYIFLVFVITAWYAFAVISSLLGVKIANGLVCLRCDGIPQPRFCNKVVECYDNELCGVEKVINDFGEHVFNLGCLSRKVCSNFTSGIHISSSTACGECCRTGDLCNSQGCGEPGYPSDIGPICYNCPIHAGAGRCHDIEFCSDTEVCNIVGKNLFSSLVYTSKCLSKHACKNVNETHVAIIGKRDVVAAKRTHELHVCDVCCSGDLCNRDCDTPSSLTDHCKSNPCVNGHCKTTGNGFVCTCNHGFSGILCDFDIDDCGNNPCGSHGTCIDGANTFTCACEQGFNGRYCSTTASATDCYDLLHRNHVTADGIYNITTWKTHAQINVFCDMTTAGGGWTVFQKRYDGSQDFHKNFQQYEDGFGDLHREFWLGLKYIHEMTSMQQSELRIDLATPDGKTAFENFQNFSVSAGPNYTLHILRGTGTAGDASNGLSYHNNMHFSTFDHDNDNSGDSNCAAASDNPGGWWFNACYVADLNGNYSYLNYYFDFSSGTPLKSSKMMFRRV